MFVLKSLKCIMFYILCINVYLQYICLTVFLCDTYNMFVYKVK